MSAPYAKGRERFLDGALSWTTDTFKVALLDGGYVFNGSTHQFVSDLGAHIVARSLSLTSKTVTGGIAGATDATCPSVGGPHVEAYAVYHDTGSDATSELIVFVDDGTGLPIIPNFGTVTVTFDGPNKVFKL